MGSEVIKILLLLLPGLIAIYVNRSISDYSYEYISNYDWLFIALVCNIPAFTFSWFMLWGINKLFVKLEISTSWDLSSLSALIVKLDSLKFVLLFVLVSIIVGIFVGYIFASQNRPESISSKLFSFLRKKLGKSDVLGAPSVWDKVCNNRDEPVIEIVTKDGKKVKGFLRDFSSLGGHKELTIDSLDVVEKWKEYFDEIKSVYYHLDSGTLIKIYDKTKYLETLKKNGRI